MTKKVKEELEQKLKETQALVEEEARNKLLKE